VTVVAGAEELFLRGSLYDAVTTWRGEGWAIAVGALGFALLHVPMYGWHVLPLDLAVGLVLGGLRQHSGTPVAPAITHIGADFVGWFLR
jgi:membrane protease YdiL (CAAX protease family)